MGKNTPPKCSESRVRARITDYELRITNWSRAACFLGFFCVFASIAFAQAIPQTDPDLEALALKINKGNSEQKRDALFQIRTFKTAEASRIALPALRDSSESVRAEAVSSVIFLPPDEAAQNLLPLLNDKNVLVRRETAYALGKTRSLLAIQPLIQKFQAEKIDDVKNACVAALGEIGDTSAVGFLTQILRNSPKKEDDADEFLRRSAARSIGQIAQKLQTGASETYTPQNLLIASNTAASKILLLNYKNLSVNFPAFRDSASALIQVLQSSKEVDDTKREAAFALGAIGDDSAIQALQSNVNAADYYLGRICQESLAKISSVSAPLTKSLPSN